MRQNGMQTVPDEASICDELGARMGWSSLTKIECQSLASSIQVQMQPGCFPPWWACWGAELLRHRGLCWSTEQQYHRGWAPAESSPPLGQTGSDLSWLLPDSDLWPPHLSATVWTRSSMTEVKSFKRWRRIPLIETRKEEFWSSAEMQNECWGLNDFVEMNRLAKC